MGVLFLVMVKTTNCRDTLRTTVKYLDIFCTKFLHLQGLFYMELHINT